MTNRAGGRPVRAALLCCLTVAMAMGQQPSFDAASVKAVNLAAHPVFGNRGGPGSSDPGRTHLCCVGMFSLLMRAYDVELDQISGPAWIMDNAGPNLYEIDATFPPATTKVQYQQMMQRLLAERFHLQVHRERRNYPGYELVAGAGGVKLKETKPDPNAPTEAVEKRDAAGKLLLQPGPQMLTTYGWGVVTVQVQQKPLSELVKVLGRMINQSQGENPNDYLSPKARVLDRTGLRGTYDFTLHFSCELCQIGPMNANGTTALTTPLPADSPGGEPSIFTAVQKQLGLKLNRVKDVPLDVIVVDRVDKVPTAN